MRDAGDILALGHNIRKEMADIKANLPIGIEPVLVADHPGAGVPPRGQASGTGARQPPAKQVELDQQFRCFRQRESQSASGGGQLHNDSERVQQRGRVARAVPIAVDQRNSSRQFERHHQPRRPARSVD